MSELPRLEKLTENRRLNLAEQFAQGQALTRGILRLFQGFMALGLLVCLTTGASSAGSHAPGTAAAHRCVGVTLARGVIIRTTMTAVSAGSLTRRDRRERPRAIWLQPLGGRRR